MYTQELRIPKERIGALVGIKGRMKQKIQRKTDTQIAVNADGEVCISGEDSLHVFMTLTVIRAIGRGFSPDRALVLLEEDNTLEVVDITDFSRKNSNDLTRIRARVIGTNGKAREMLESLTKTKLSVYGKTVAILGAIPDVMLAKAAVEKLLQGAPHSNVYHLIEKQRTSLREKF